MLSGIPLPEKRSTDRGRNPSAREGHARRPLSATAGIRFRIRLVHSVFFRPAGCIFWRAAQMTSRHSSFRRL